MTNATGDHEQQPLPELEDLLAQYLALAEQGAAGDVESLIAQNPLLRQEILDFVMMDQQFRKKSTSESDCSEETVLSDSACDANFLSSGDILQTVGEYELLEEIDRGGMGVVFRARHKRLRRIAAVKMLLAGSLASEDAQRRFRREADAAARLNHPGIVPVYDVGVVDRPGELTGRTWFAMALVEGSDLGRRIEQDLFSGKEGACLGIRIAEAVHYAHEKGVIHRDLKPANILIDQDGCPHVSDFGLSRCQDNNDTRLTADGQIFGTPGYMSPEQAAGRNDEVGAGSDVYSLGAVLYCMLTGRPPFRANSTMVTLQQVIHDVPAPPRLLNPAVHPDLESIVLKCLEKNPQDRYATALLLRDDLERFSRGESVSAASVNLVGYIGRVIARSRNTEFLQGWSQVLYLIGTLGLVAHLVLQFGSLTATQSTVLNAGKYGLLLAIIWRARRGILTPKNPVERTIWSLWIGYILTYLVAEIMVRIARSDPTNYPLTVYPLMSLVSSVILMVLGGQLWGGCYVLSGLFLLAAIVLTAASQPGAIVFGGLWASVYFLLGRRYHLQSEKT